MIRVIGNVLLVVSAVLATLFVVVYQITAPWWRSEMGRHLMAFNGVIAAVLWLSVIRVFVPGSVDLLWFNIVRLIVFALVPVVLAWRLWMLIKAQVLRRR